MCAELPSISELGEKLDLQLLRYPIKQVFNGSFLMKLPLEYLLAIERKVKLKKGLCKFSPVLFYLYAILGMCDIAPGRKSLVRITSLISKLFGGLVDSRMNRHLKGLGLNLRGYVAKYSALSPQKLDFGIASD